MPIAELMAFPRAILLALALLPGTAAEAGAVAPPVIAGPLRITGDAEPDGTLQCELPAITGESVFTDVSWLRDDKLIDDAYDPAYVVVESDVGRHLACSLTAANAGGLAVADSESVLVSPRTSPPPATPQTVSPPSAAPTRGATLAEPPCRTLRGRRCTSHRHSVNAWHVLRGALPPSGGARVRVQLERTDPRCAVYTAAGFRASDCAAAGGGIEVPGKRGRWELRVHGMTAGSYRIRVVALTASGAELGSPQVRTVHVHGLTAT